MKLKKYKIIFVIAFLICMIIILHTNSYAATMKMSINKSSAYVGDTFSVTISGINGRVNISSNSNISIDKSGSQWVDGSLTIAGTTVAVGTGTIMVAPVDVTTTGAEPEEVTSSASKSIIIKEKEQPQPTTPTQPTNPTVPTTPPKSNNNTTTNKTTKTDTKKEENKEDSFYISSVTLKGVKENGEQIDIALSPTFNKDTYKYTCHITSDIEKIDLQKDAGKYTNSVIVTGLEELKEGENIIELQLSAEDHESKIYTIKVIKEKQEIIETVAKVEKNKKEETIIKNKQQKTKMVSMPLWIFMIMQIVIIIIEVIVIYFVPWRQFFKINNKNIDMDE